MSKSTEALERAIVKEGHATGYWKKVAYYLPDMEIPPITRGDEPTPDLKKAIENVSLIEHLFNRDARVLIATAGNFMQNCYGF